MRGRRIFLTGATGFFGIWILETIRHINETFGGDISVAMLSREPDAFFRRYPHFSHVQWLRAIRGDIVTFPFPDLEIDDVIHAATPVVSTIPPLELWDTIVGGTRRTLEFAVTAHAKRFLLTSSGAVYGSAFPPGTRLDEMHMTAPTSTSPASAYGLGKRAAEWLCCSYGYSSGMECKIARCFAFAGPHLPYNQRSALSSFIHDALHEPTIRVAGDGTAVRSYLYATDLVVSLFSILDRGAPFIPYNIGAEQGISTLELANMVRRIAGCDKAVIVEKLLTSGMGCNWYVPSTSRIRHDLHLAPSVSLEDALRRTIKWFRAPQSSI